MIKRLLQNQDVQKGVYVLVWGVISFVSSFIDILHGDFSFITVADITKTVFPPVLIWSIAFFVDYIFEIAKLDESKQRLSKTWTIISYLMIVVILLSLLINVFCANIVWRILCVAVIFLSMMTLKTSSLYVLCPLQRVGKM